MRRALCILAVLGVVVAQDTREQPIALVIRSEGGSLVRAGSELGLTARAGDLLHAGDVLRASSGSITFLFCPESVTYSLAAGGEVVMDRQIKSALLGNRSAAPRCYLPPIARNVSASQMHTGASIARALAPDAGTGTFDQRVAALPALQRSALAAELNEADQAIAAAPNEPTGHLSRAGVFEKYGLAADAAAAYRKLSELWPEAMWIKTRLFTLEQETAGTSTPGTMPAAPAAPGRTLALLVGISRYRSPEIRPLNFAHQDASLMGEYLRSERGGRLPDDQIVLLTNEQATTAAIRNTFEAFLKGQAGQNDTIVLLVATHGTVIETKGKRGAYIITYDSDPQDLETTALAMEDVQKLIREDLTRVGRVIAFVDVCRSGTIGTLPRNAKVNSVVERLAEADGQLFLFTASRANEFSFEGPQYGGGHGAFSFFLMEALNGAGDLNNDGRIVINELIEYTQQKVAEGTADRQHPRENGNYEGTTSMADNKLPGIAMQKFTPLAPGSDRTAALTTTESRSFERSAAIGARPVRAIALREQVDFEEALHAGRILPDGQRNAFTALRQYQRRVKPSEYLAQASRLQTALENRGQQLLLNYLEGDQVPQTRNDFAAGAAFFGAARLLTPESILLESRETFCLGRMRIFDKDYSGAAQMLERAIRLDPEGAYSYNALGIAELEQANYERAARAFREAIRHAPYWAYPLHNLALAYTEMGNYSDAIRAYREAMRLAPRYAYLPYNLGLIYQRLNRRKDAEASYRRALQLAPGDGMPLNALGYLSAASGQRRDAERYYREALSKSPEMLAARHNLAVLLAERRETADEAVTLWRQNLAKDDGHLPSRLSLARVLAEQGDDPGATVEYERVVKDRPDYAAARVALGRLLARSGKREPALAQFREAVRLQPGNLDAWELIGDNEKQAGRTTEAASAYRKALDLAQDGSAKKRIRRKM